MRKLTTRDFLATLAVAAVLIPFIGYSARGSWPFVEDPRGMAAVGIIGAVVTVSAFDRRSFRRDASSVTMWLLAGVAIGFGLAALIAETVWWLLVPMIVGLVAMWIVGVLHDAGVPAHAAG